MEGSLLIRIKSYERSGIESLAAGIVALTVGVMVLLLCAGFLSLIEHFFDADYYIILGPGLIAIAYGILCIWLAKDYYPTKVDLLKIQLAINELSARIPASSSGETKQDKALGTEPRKRP